MLCCKIHCMRGASAAASQREPREFMPAHLTSPAKADDRVQFPLQDNTAGQFNERLYRYGVSLKAQEPRDAESCYRVQTG